MRMYCPYCGSHKHTLKNCPHTWPGQTNRRNLYCIFCGSHKHNVNGCPKRFVYDPNNIDDYVKD